MRLVDVRVRAAAAACAFSTLAACATAPAPPPAQPDAAGALHLCAGMGISNAPSADSRGRITGYTPYAEIRGLRLARAPVAACLSSGYGPRKGGASSFHKGLDLYTRAPAPVYAAAGGVVVSAGKRNGYGNVIAIRHKNGVETRYAHLSAFAPGIRRGARVKEGEIIAETGRTGNAAAIHLHYEILIDGRTVNPLTVG